MTGRYLLIPFISLFTALIVLSCVSNPPAEHSASAEVLPIDPAVTLKKLNNGLTYYIRENRKPENRAELRLVINAGSVLEDEDQRGLAHFVEHMAFNGTLHFRKMELVDHLESVGMRFGPEINAYTGFDETVYLLEIPTDDAEIIEKGFQILEDWAHNISFEEVEIDKERGVIVEEWRLGRGAESRMQDRQFPILFQDSRYADRLPIGKKHVIEGAPYERIRQFYEDWYKPELMAVIAVGDFDSSSIERRIVTHFSALPSSPGDSERTLYPVPNHDEILFAIASDPEATASRVRLYMKHDAAQFNTVADYRRRLVESLYAGMLNNRLYEVTQKSDPPFISGYTGRERFVRTKDAVYLAAIVKDGGIEKGLKAILSEAERVRRHGFTATELDREKKELLRAREQYYRELDKLRSSQFAAEYVRNFLYDEPIPGIEYEYEFYTANLPSIELVDVNRFAKNWIIDENRVVLVNSPGKQDLSIPGEKELTRVFSEVQNASLLPYQDKTKEEPLLTRIPEPGFVIEESFAEETGITSWTLSNGIRVLLKPTDFKNNQVLFEGLSPGGHSLVPDKDYISAITAISVIMGGGLDGFDKIELGKKLAGKSVYVSPWIGELYEGVRGNASPDDLETLFQLIHLTLTQPRKDQSSFQSYKNRLKVLVENRKSSPESLFYDTVQTTMTRNHFRSRPLTERILEEMNLDRSFRIYRDRFADTGDFTFIFVGNLNLDDIKPLISTYLGGLPAAGRVETWKDLKIDPPSEFIDRTVWRGLEPKSRVQIIFAGDFTWSGEETITLDALADILELRRMQESKIDDIYLTKEKEIMRRSREEALKGNRFWLRSLAESSMKRENPVEILKYGQMIEKLNPGHIQTAARAYLSLDNYIRVVLYPEEQK